MTDRSIDGNLFQTYMLALEWDAKRAGKILGRSRRTVNHWVQYGAPKHALLTVQMILAGRLTSRTAAAFMQRARTRPYRRAA